MKFPLQSSTGAARPAGRMVSYREQSRRAGTPRMVRGKHDRIGRVAFDTPVARDLALMLVGIANRRTIRNIATWLCLNNMTAKRFSTQDRILQELEAIRSRLSHFEEALTGIADKIQGRGQRSSVATILDALSTHIALLDSDGGILFTNRAWRQFGIQNGIAEGFDWKGINYLHICHAAADEDAAKWLTEYRTL